MASSLVRSSPDRVSLAGDILTVLRQDTLLSQCHSPPEVHIWVPVNVMLGVTLQWTTIPSRELHAIIVNRREWL